ncbi:MAG: DUF4405 domain-containing protein [Rubrivivax sp.]|nr:DUF4405 domain-containing protein [Rubrivivax sp.]
MNPSGNISETREAKSRAPFQWRAWVSVVVLLSFAVLAASGFVLWVAPPGRIANWGDWTLLGLRKSEWAALHIWFALVFAIMALTHLVFNWRPLLCYFKNRLSQQWGFRREWIAAAALCAVVFVGVRREFPPFSSLLAFTHDVRQSWDQPGGRGHRDSAAKFSSAPQTNSASHLGEPGLGAGGGRGAGGGYGRQTLAEVCASVGVDLATAQDRLKKSGLQASPRQTLREIADANGFQRPAELLRIIRGEENPMK